MLGFKPQPDIYDRGRAADDMGQRDLFACYSFPHIIRTCSCGALDPFISAPRSKDGFLLFIIVSLVCKVKGRRESGHESTPFTKKTAT